MLLSETESKTTGCINPQVTGGPRAAVDLVHADTHLVRNLGGPVYFSSISRRRRNGEG